MRISISEFGKLLKKAWSKETSADPKDWTPKNPSLGQCAVTALVFQDFFGGELLRGLANIKEANTVSHYWNRFPGGTEIDMTGNQFPKGTTISTGGVGKRNYVLSYPNTLKRYVLLRLRVENLIQPNPLFSNPIYRICFETALTSECQKMKFGCLVIHKGKVVARTANWTIEPLKYLCQPKCIRLKIQSRTESMIGACGHAEEWALWETVRLGIPLEDCSFYIAGFVTKTSQPWVKKETKDHTCLRCSVQMYMAGVKKIYVPFIDHWESTTPEEAVEASAKYALGKKKV